MRFARLERIRDRARQPETWQDRVKRAAAPRKAVQVDAVPIPWVPSPILVACLMAHGMPRRQAVLIRQSKQLYYVATRFYFDTLDAEAGEADAKARVDLFRENQERMRRIEKEQVGVDPDRREPVVAGPSKRTIHIPKGIDATR